MKVQGSFEGLFVAFPVCYIASVMGEFRTVGCSLLSCFIVPDNEFPIENDLL